MPNPNIQALASIASNLSEILVYANGIPLLLGAGIAQHHKFTGHAIKFVVIAFACLAVSLFAHVLINDLLPQNELEAAVVGWLILIAVGIPCAWAYFAPTIIALTRDKKRALPIILLNLFGVIMPFWLYALLRATAPERNESQPVDTALIDPLFPLTAIGLDRVSAPLSPELLTLHQQIFEHIARLEALLSSSGAADSARRLKKVLSSVTPSPERLARLKDELTNLFLVSDWPQDISDEMRAIIEEITACSD